MPADASAVQASTSFPLTAAAAIQVGDVWQLPDGRGAVYSGSSAATSGDDVNFLTQYIHSYVKAAGFVALAGGRAYWDHSANAVSYFRNGDRDFYLGRFTDDATSDATTCSVDISVGEWDGYNYGLDKGYFSVLVGTPAAGGFGYPVPMGDSLQLELTATNEAQKVDALSHEGWASGGANAIVEGCFIVEDDGAGTAVDFSIGVASDTHASDANSIAQYVLFHLDANTVNILAQSTDGTVSVVATDTTLDYTMGASYANRVEFWIDMRDISDCQLYVNGVLVLGSTAFNVSQAAAAWKLLAHLEKTASTDTYKIHVPFLRARTSEQ